MARVLNIKTINDDKINVTLEMSQKELLWLKGNMDKMHLFSENNLNEKTRVVERGRRDCTKYFLLPKKYKEGFVNKRDVMCTRIISKLKNIYIFSLDRY